MSSPEQEAIQHLYDAFNAVSRTPSRSGKETSTLAAAQAQIASAVGLIREIYPRA